MRENSTGRVWGMVGAFSSAEALVRGAREVRIGGYRRWDAHSPFPVHGMDRAMGLGRSVLGWIVLAAGVGGAVAGMGLQWFVNAVDYPLVTQGKPYFSWQAFVPVTFELMVLFAAFAAVGGMLVLNGLPRWYHPTLKCERFARATDDGFFIVIEAADSRFDLERTRRELEEAGAVEVEVVWDGAEEGTEGGRDEATKRRSDEGMKGRSDQGGEMG